MQGLETRGEYLATREDVEKAKSEVIKEGLNKSPLTRRSREGRNLAQLRNGAVTPILTFPHQGGRDLFRGSLRQ